jgi:hypothetical protein
VGGGDKLFDEINLENNLYIGIRNASFPSPLPTPLL